MSDEIRPKYSLTRIILKKPKNNNIREKYRGGNLCDKFYAEKPLDEEEILKLIEELDSL